jgi:sulfopyruvate decarboxylase TPP-binding subunit
MDRPDLAHSVGAAPILQAWRAAGIRWVVTVPDFVQLSLHAAIARPDSGLRSITTASENQAVETAAGLHAGGERAVVMMQNQGLYNCLNAIRALGLDAQVPLFLSVGQFGREFANLGSDPRRSRRRMVSLLEPVMDAIGMPYFRVESSSDLPNVALAADAAFARKGPSAMLIGHYTTWE